MVISLSNCLSKFKQQLVHPILWPIYVLSAGKCRVEPSQAHEAQSSSALWGTKEQPRQRAASGDSKSLVAYATVCTMCPRS